MSTSAEYGEAEFLCYQILKQMEQKSEKDIYETEFNKLCYMAYCTLEEEGFELDLPVYWYKFGGVVDAPGRYPLEFKPNDDNTLVLAKDVSEEAFKVASHIRSKIIQTARSLADRYKNTYGTETIKNDSYEECAPTEFVRVFNEFRSTVDDLETEQESLSSFAGTEDGKMGALRQNMDTLIQEYPSELYAEMEPEFRQWDSITRQLAKNNQVSEIQEFTRRFWEAFSRVELRLKHHSNIRADKLRRWRAIRDSERARFQESIKTYRELALQSREPTNKLDAVAEPYSQTVRQIIHTLNQES